VTVVVQKAVEVAFLIMMNNKANKKVLNVEFSIELRPLPMLCLFIIVTSTSSPAAPATTVIMINISTQQGNPMN